MQFCAQQSEILDLPVYMGDLRIQQLARDGKAHRLCRARPKWSSTQRGKKPIANTR
jgi:hypothetical protein